MAQPLYFGGSHQTDWMAGDVYPSNFSFLSNMTAQHLLELYKRNEFIQISVDWMTYEAFRQGISFLKEEEIIQGKKFGQDYIFEGYTYMNPETGEEITVSGFQEYLMWIDMWKLFIRGASWSRLYDEGALLVFLDDILPNEATPGNDQREWKSNPDPQGYSSFRVFQPLACGTETGFSVQPSDWDETTNTIKRYRLQLRHAKEVKDYLVDADRCVHLLWRKRENSWKATSRVRSFAHVALIEEQITKRLVKRANDLAGGILTIDAESKEEMTEISNSLGNDLTSTDIIFKKPGREIEYKTPDLKAAGEFASIFDILAKKLCRHMRISKLLLDGEHDGPSLGGNDNGEIMNSYTEMFQIQNHYRNALEHVFFKLGKSDTRFVYNDILPDDLMVDDEINDGGNDNGEEETNDTEKDNAESGNGRDNN